MKVVVFSSLVVILASLLVAVLPFSGADKVKCEKQHVCLTSTAVDGIVDPKESQLVECDECAAWNCNYNGVKYAGWGCKGDENVCKNGNNQEESESYNGTNLFATCKEPSNPKCATKKLREYNEHNNVKFDLSAIGGCVPNKVTTEPIPGKPKCFKDNYCYTLATILDPKSDGEPTFVNCDECAGWSCLEDEILYKGFGCKSDPNFCKYGNNQDGSENHDGKSAFVSCKEPSDTSGACAIEKLQKYLHDKGQLGLPVKIGDCDPNPPPRKQPEPTTAPKKMETTTTPSGDETKNGALKIAGMILLGWMFARF